jgi:hypothetical protein
LRAERQTVGSQPDEQAQASGGKNESNEAARRGQEAGFDQRLTHDVDAACAEGLAHGNLLHASAGANQEQVGQIDDADKEQREDTPLQQKQSGADGGDVISMQRHHKGTESGGSHLFGLRVIGFEGSVLGIDLSLRLLDGDVWLEAGNHLNDVAAGVPLSGRAVCWRRG